MRHQCDECKRNFISKPALRQHKKTNGHCKCPHCPSILASVQGVHDHCKDLHTIKCPQCPETRETKLAMKSHQKTSNHCYCGDCSKAFPSLSALRDHLQSSLHSTDFQCCDCNKTFRSSQALEQHLQDKQHVVLHCPVCSRRFRDSPALRRHVLEFGHSANNRNRYCQACSKTFKSPQGLNQHMSSPKHKPLCRIKCASTRCKKTFSTPSGLLHHLESGTCPSGVTRKQINQLVLAHDTDRIISQDSARFAGFSLAQVNERLLENTVAAEERLESEAGASTPASSYDFTTSSILSPGLLTPQSTSQLSDEWNCLMVSQAPNNRCPFCPITRPPFSSKSALQQHLQSPAHAAALVYCPVSLDNNGLEASTRKSFTTVSGLTQHVESGACVGEASAFWRALESLTKRVKSKGLKLMGS